MQLEGAFPGRGQRQPELSVRLADPSAFRPPHAGVLPQQQAHGRDQRTKQVPSTIAFRMRMISSACGTGTDTFQRVRHPWLQLVVGAMNATPEFLTTFSQNPASVTI